MVLTLVLVNSVDARSARRVAGFLAFGAALGCFDAAQAQVAGMPTGTERFSLSGTAGAAYDSNITGGNAAIGNLRDLRPEDVTYSLASTAAFQLPSSRQTLFIDGSFDLQRHQNNPALDANDYSIAAGFSERLGICSTTGVVSYSRRQSLIQDIAIATTKNTATQESGNINVSCGRRSMFVTVQADASKLTNDAKAPGFVDSTAENVSASVGYRNQTLGDLSVFTHYSNIDYGQDSILGLSTPSVQQYGVGLRYARKIGSRLSGSAGISYDRVQGGLIGSQSDGISANASVAYRLSSRIQFSLDYSLGNSASPLGNASYVRTNALQVGGSYSLTKRISFHGGASRSRQDYRGTEQVTLLQIRESTTDQINAGLDIKVGRKSTASLIATYTSRVADVSQFNYNDDRVAVTLTSRF